VLVVVLVVVEFLVPGLHTDSTTRTTTTTTTIPVYGPDAPDSGSDSGQNIPLTPNATCARMNAGSGGVAGKLVEWVMRRVWVQMRSLAFAAYVAVLLAGLNEHELCIGDDGHVGLDLPGRGCCGGCPDPASRDAGGEPAAESFAVAGDCGGCVDIPLSFTGDDHHAPRGARALTSFRGASDTWQGTSETRLVPGELTLDPWLVPPARSVPAVSLRSDVLRI
jgi:hypothetical protein